MSKLCRDHGLVDPIHRMYGSPTPPFATWLDGRNAPDVVFCEELEYEICRATRTSLGKFDNDATACYDRIPCFLANITSQKYGLDRKICIVQGRTLKEARYYLKTQLGVSDGFIKHCKAYPIYGTGQGSGNSPVYWAFISSVLFDCHASKAQGATFCSPDSTVKITLYMLGFVDDTSNRTNDFTNGVQPDVQRLLDLMSGDAQLWQDLLYSSGGDLELPKCSFHHIRFKFSPNGRPYMRQGRFSPNLFVTTSQGTKVRIKQLCTSKSHKLLGCHKAPDGNQENQMASTAETCHTQSHIASFFTGFFPWAHNFNIMANIMIRLVTASCTLYKETEHHYYRCPCDSRKAWRKKFVQTIKDTCKSQGVLPDLVKIMVAGVWTFFGGSLDNNGTTALFPHVYAYKYRELIKQQNQIGWLNFIRGRWSKEWTRLQHQETKKQLSDGKDTIKGNWIVKVNHAMWTTFWEGWETRNSDRHGTDYNTRYQARQRLLHREAELLHSRAKTYPEELFSIPLETLLAKSNCQLYNWISTWTKVMDDLDDLDSRSEPVCVTDSDEDL